jgi:hypothetical protein
VTLNGFPYAEIVFGTDGLPTDPSQRGTAAPPADDPDVTDLLVLSHGWNDDVNRAESLYDGLTAAMARAGGAPPGLAVVGILWPSKRYDADPAAMAATTAALTADPARRAAFVRTTRSGVTTAAPAPSWADPGDQQDMFFGMDPAALFDQLGGLRPEGAAAGFADAGSAATAPATGAESGPLDPIADGVANVLNLATYYEMKARSGLVGGKGLAPILAATRRARPYLRLHLAGHSFGARVVASALAAGGPLPVSSATLIQGAFSHFAFARHWDGAHDGLFRPALLGGRVTGPLVVTYSSHDQMVGLAYALASRLAGQTDSALGPIGGPHDRFGAIGANGALATPESMWLPMLPVGGPAYALTAGAVCNLESSPYIPSHFAVAATEVGQAIVAAIDTDEIGTTEG